MQLLLLLLPVAAQGATPVPRTFGNGVLSAIANSSHPALLVLNHTLHADSEYGVMTHYWSTGELVNWDTVIDYFVDGVRENTIPSHMPPCLPSAEGSVLQFLLALALGCPKKPHRSMKPELE